MISARFEGLDSFLDELGTALDGATMRAMDEATVTVANHAAREHRYTSRTGRLQNSTVPAGVSGSFMRGSLRGRIIADTPYGSYLEDPSTVDYEGDGNIGFGVDVGITQSKWAFLFPAYLARKGEIENGFDAALNVGDF